MAVLAASLAKGGLFTLSLDKDTGYAAQNDEGLPAEIVKISHIVPMANFSIEKCPFVFLLSIDRLLFDWGGFRGSVFVPKTWQLWTGSRSGELKIYDVV